jgi:hypothetical protein
MYLFIFIYIHLGWVTDMSPGGVYMHKYVYEYKYITMYAYIYTYIYTCGYMHETYSYVRICIFTYIYSYIYSGWVTDMSPGGVGATSKIHETFIGMFMYICMYIKMHVYIL